MAGASALLSLGRLFHYHDKCLCYPKPVAPVSCVGLRDCGRREHKYNYSNPCIFPLLLVYHAQTKNMCFHNSTVVYITNVSAPQTRTKTIKQRYVHLLVERNHRLGDILHCTRHGFMRPDSLELEPYPLKMAPKLDELCHIIPCSDKVLRQYLHRTSNTQRVV